MSYSVPSTLSFVKQPHPSHLDSDEGEPLVLMHESCHLCRVIHLRVLPRLPGGFLRKARETRPITLHSIIFECLQNIEYALCNECGGSIAMAPQ